MWWRAIVHVFAMQWLAYLFTIYVHAHMKHHAMLCQRRACINKQAGRQARKLVEKSKEANRQPKEKNRNEKKLTHKYLNSFILLFVCLGEMSMSASMNMHITTHGVWYTICSSHTTPHHTNYVT